MSTMAEITLVIGGMPDPLLGRWPRSRPVLSLIASVGAPDIRRERYGGHMNNKEQNLTTVSRRAVIAGAAAGSVTLASAPASAQRCPATPPARTKGPLVWM